MGLETIATIIVSAAGFVIIFLAGGVARFVWAKFSKIDRLDASQNEIRYNYLNRFDELKMLLSAGNAETQKKLNDMHMDMALNYVRRVDCNNCGMAPPVTTGGA